MYQGDKKNKPQKGDDDSVPTKSDRRPVLYSAPTIIYKFYTMTTDFMNDTEYIELCGSKTVLDVVSTLGGIFDKHEFW